MKYWKVIAGSAKPVGVGGCVSTVDCCRRTSFFGSVLFSYFAFCSFKCCSACRYSVCRLAMSKWLFSP